MAIESERKFLVRSSSWQSRITHSYLIQQFYLIADSDRSLRVRLKEGNAILTLKLGHAAREREEYEFPLSNADASAMKPYAIGHMIEKTRHIVHDKAQLYEIDVFGGGLTGLILAELETFSEIPDNQLPDWIGREVTGEHAFYNASLATRGLDCAKILPGNP